MKNDIIEALAMLIVPEDTAFYRTSFEKAIKTLEQQLDISMIKQVLNKDLRLVAQINTSFFRLVVRKINNSC